MIKVIPQGKTFLADFSLITSLEELQITEKTTLIDHLVIPFLIVRSTEEDVVLNINHVSM